MYRLAYIAPVLTCAILLVHFQDYEQWWLYAIMAGVSCLFLWLAMRRGTRTKEYLSAYAVKIVHHEPWVERVTYQETYTDSKGNTHTRTRVRYVHHPDVWFMPMNTGVAPHISHSTYDSYRRLWGTPVNHIHPFHANCVSGGGGQEYEWQCLISAFHTHRSIHLRTLWELRAVCQLCKVFGLYLQRTKAEQGGNRGIRACRLSGLLRQTS